MMTWTSLLLEQQILDHQRQAGEAEEEDQKVWHTQHGHQLGVHQAQKATALKLTHSHVAHEHLWQWRPMSRCTQVEHYLSYGQMNVPLTAHPLDYTCVDWSLHLEKE